MRNEYHRRNERLERTVRMTEAAKTSQRARRGGDAGQAWNFAWLILPLAVLYGIFALLPLGIIVRFSVANGLENFRVVLASPLLLRVATNTLAISLTTTVLTLALAIPVAAALWRSGPRLRS